MCECATGRYNTILRAETCMLEASIQHFPTTAI
jgi:hypothetical protein